MTPKKGPKATRQGVLLGQDRETVLERRKAYRNSALTVLVITNGTKTEKQYFDALRRNAWGNPFHLTVKKYAPAELVEFAASEKSDAAYDQVWCVFDVDEFDVADAIRMAKEAKIEIALSNPCFEVWLILHKKDCRKAFQNAKEVEQALAKLVRNWDKSNLRIQDFWDTIDDAIRRAEVLGDPPGKNPSTSVWKLMQFLRVADQPTAPSS